MPIKLKIWSTSPGAKRGEKSKATLCIVFTPDWLNHHYMLFLVKSSLHVFSYWLNLIYRCFLQLVKSSLPVFSDSLVDCEAHCAPGFEPFTELRKVRKLRTKANALLLFRRFLVCFVVFVCLFFCLSWNQNQSNYHKHEEPNGPIRGPFLKTTHIKLTGGPGNLYCAQYSSTETPFSLILKSRL